MITLENRGNKKGIRKKVGDVFRIPLGNQVYAYGQAVTIAANVFFDYTDNGVNTDVDKILNSIPLFKVTVDRYVLSKGYWEIIGKYPVDPTLSSYEDAFIYDPIIKQYLIFKDGIGQIPATWEEIKNLEPLTSWGHGSVEQRLKDYLAGRPNYDIEYFHRWDRENFPDIYAFYKQYGYDFKYPGDEEK